MKVPIPERGQVCPPAGVQLQLPSTNKTVTVTHNIDISAISSSKELEFMETILLSDENGLYSCCLYTALVGAN